MRAQRGITNRVAPVHQPVLNVALHLLQPRRNFGEGPRIPFQTFQWVALQSIIREISSDPPIGPGMVAALIGFDQMTLAKAPDLVVDRIEHSQRMTRPVVIRMLLRRNLLTGIADK